MTSYAIGRRLEWLARDDLRKKGYSAVRSAGSKTPIDLVAFSNREVLAVQVKRSTAEIDLAVESLAVLVLPAQVRREVWARVPDGWRIVPVSGMLASDSIPTMPAAVVNFWSILNPTGRSGQ